MKAANKKVADDLGFTKLPTFADGEPSRATLGGMDYAISSYSKHPKQTFDAAMCLRTPEHQLQTSLEAGDPPVAPSVYEQAEFKKAYPHGSGHARRAEDGRPAPDHPALPEHQHHRVLHAVAAQLDQPRRDRQAAQGLDPAGHRWKGDPAVSTATVQQEDGVEIAKKRASEGKKAEQKLGMMLCAPAVFVMLIVTAYPILYAFYLSFFRADLRTPDANEFIGLSNYVTVLSSSIWWTAFGDHAVPDRRRRLPRAGARHGAGDRHAPHDRRPRPGPHLGAGALRHRHRGGGVLLALRLDPGHGLAGRATPLR